jgi:hypothetical protein
MITGYSNTISVTTSAPSLLLDLYPNAQFAVSVRKLRAAYTGSAIRVRRSSDNAEQDIGFSGTDLDTGALTTFCASTNGYIVRWYDQSGNGNDVTQGTGVDQPQIVSGGSVLTTNGKPSAFFDGTNDFMITTGTPFSATENTLIGVSQQASISANYKRLMSVGQYNSGRYLGSNQNYNQMLAIFNNSTLTCSGGVSLSQNLSIMYNNGTNGVLWQNGANVNTITANNGSYPNANIYLGSDIAGGGAEFWNGIGQEYIFYPTSQSANLSGISTNINTYYGIY